MRLHFSSKHGANPPRDTAKTFNEISLSYVEEIFSLVLSFVALRPSLTGRITRPRRDL